MVEMTGPPHYVTIEGEQREIRCVAFTKMLHTLAESRALMREYGWAYVGEGEDDACWYMIIAPYLMNGPYDVLLWRSGVRVEMTQGDTSFERGQSTDHESETSPSGHADARG